MSSLWGQMGIKRRALSLTRLAITFVIASFSANAADYQGQLVLQSETAADTVTGQFQALSKFVQLRVYPATVSEIQLSVNNEVIFDGEVRPSQNAVLMISDTNAVKPGNNNLDVHLRKGDVAVTVDYPVLREASSEQALTIAQKREFRKALQPYIGTDPEQHLFPGAALLVARNGEILFAEGHGMAQFQRLSNGRVERDGLPRKMFVDTVFDLASVTKVASTTAAIMHLVSENKLSLSDTLGELLPGFAETDKASITVQQLLTHRSGLWEWQPTWLHRKLSNASVYTYLAALNRRYPIGEKRAYSDVGFMLLGYIVSRVSGESIDDYVKKHIHTPLGMMSTTYTPPATWRENIAATSQGNQYEQNMVATSSPYPILSEPAFTETFSGYRDYTLVGEVNDGNAWYGLDGVAGHAGLFSNITDLARFCQMMLNEGGYGNAMIASPETVAAFLSTPFDTNQAHGFWRYESGDGRVSFGHAGFTGTQIMFRPDDKLIVIMLTNRQHNGLPESGRYPSLKPAWDSVLSVIDKLPETKKAP